MTNPLWNAAGHRARIRSLGVTNEATRIVSVDEDGKAIEWIRGPAGFVLAFSRQLPDGQSLPYGVSPDVQEIATGRSSGELLIMNMADRHSLFRDLAASNDLLPLSVDGVRVAAIRANGTAAVVQEIGAVLSAQSRPRWRESFPSTGAVPAGLAPWIRPALFTYGIP